MCSFSIAGASRRRSRPERAAAHPCNNDVERPPAGRWPAVRHRYIYKLVHAVPNVIIVNGIQRPCHVLLPAGGYGQRVPRRRLHDLCRRSVPHNRTTSYLSSATPYNRARRTTPDRVSIWDRSQLSLQSLWMHGS